MKKGTPPTEEHKARVLELLEGVEILEQGFTRREILDATITHLLAIISLIKKATREDIWPRMRLNMGRFLKRELEQPKNETKNGRLE